MTDPSAASAIPSPGARQRRGTMVLADISGFTGFLQGVADAHIDLIVEADEPPPAYAIVSHLLDTLVTAMAPTFQLAKLEGDAVFVVADEGAVDGPGLVAGLRGWYGTFREAHARAGELWTCTCAACSTLGHLDLKFIVHHGPYVAQSIAGREELLGASVNVAHRLLKNGARELVGSSAYALVTDATVQALHMPLEGFVAGVESVHDLPDVPVHVLALP
jgi:hypothetical protein